MARLRVGVIGTGFVTDQLHMPAFKAIQDVAEVVAVAGLDESRTNAFAKKWGIGRAYHGERAVEAISRDGSIDAIDIALPNDRHHGAIVAAAENHKQVICEKPLGRDFKEASASLDVVRRYGVLHCYAENQVFAPRIRRAKDFIDSGSLGKVTSIRSVEAHSGPHSRWFWEQAHAGGGALLDMGCHSIEVSRFLLGRKPLSVLGWVETLVHETKLEDNSLVLIKHEGGALTESANSWTAKGGVDIRFEVYGSDGSIFVDSGRETGIRMFRASAEGKVGEVAEKADATSGWMYPAWDAYMTEGFVDELRHFATSILQGTKPVETFDEGALVNQLIDAAYRSARESKWVALS